jgi:hypothetical protein
MVGSNHWPIFLYTGENSSRKQRNLFFENQCLMEADLINMFCNIWQSVRGDLIVVDTPWIFGMGA